MIGAAIGSTIRCAGDGRGASGTRQKSRSSPRWTAVEALSVLGVEHPTRGRGPKQLYRYLRRWYGQWRECKWEIPVAELKQAG
jgi:hypothetical protein